MQGVPFWIINNSLYSFGKQLFSRILDFSNSFQVLFEELVSFYLIRLIFLVYLSRFICTSLRLSVSSLLQDNNSILNCCDFLVGLFFSQIDMITNF
jgi:hypothetical protein